jgi:5'-nucleotidase
VRVLITNDDGIAAGGLQALRKSLLGLEGVEVHVVAPDSNRSASARSITTRSPLWVEEVEFEDGTRGFATEGTPVDCVRFADLGLLGERPDLIVSGINHGANLGDDVTYSGTVSAAMEAVLNGCPAIAISQEYYEHPDFTLASRIAYVAAVNVLENGLAEGELINVNVPAIPAEECAGVEVTRMGKRVYQDELIERLDPRGVPYYWIGGPPPSGLAEPGTDFHAVVNHRIAITPIQLDLTARRLLGRLNSWKWQLPDVAAERGMPAVPAAAEPSTREDVIADEIVTAQVNPDDERR